MHWNVPQHQFLGQGKQSWLRVLYICIVRESEGDNEHGGTATQRAQDMMHVCQVGKKQGGSEGWCPPPPPSNDLLTHITHDTDNIIREMAELAMHYLISVAHKQTLSHTHMHHAYNCVIKLISLTLCLMKLSFGSVEGDGVSGKPS